MLPSLILCSNNKPFLNQTVMCNEKWIFMWQLATTSSVEGLRRSSKSLPKPNLHQTRVMISVCWSAAQLNHYSFLNPGKIITSEKYAQQIDEKHWKLQCLPPLGKRRVQFFSMTTPDCTLHEQHFRSWTMKFCLICHSHLTSCHRLPLLQASWQLFCRQNASTISRKKKMLSKSSLNPKAWIFMLQE